MSSSQSSDPLTPPRHHSTTTFRWTLRGRRRRLATVRLGGKKPCRGLFLARVCKRVKLKWLKGKYLCMMKKVKEYYKDVVEGPGPGAEGSFHRRMLLESSYAVPVMGLSFMNYPSSRGHY